ERGGILDPDTPMAEVAPRVHEELRCRRSVEVHVVCVREDELQEAKGIVRTRPLAETQRCGRDALEISSREGIAPRARIGTAHDLERLARGVGCIDSNEWDELLDRDAPRHVPVGSKDNLPHLPFEYGRRAPHLRR